MKKINSKLQRLMDQLGHSHQQSVLDFASFLVQQYAQPASADAKPESIARPEDESVIAALKRLKKTYAMLETGELLNQSSALVAQHMMQGRTATEVIDDLEALFDKQYQQYQAQ